MYNLGHRQTISFHTSYVAAGGVGCGWQWGWQLGCGGGGSGGSVAAPLAVAAAAASVAADSVGGSLKAAARRHVTKVEYFGTYIGYLPTNPMSHHSDTSPTNPSWIPDSI
jgi:hypothetical protein